MWWNCIFLKQFWMKLELLKAFIFESFSGKFKTILLKKSTSFYDFTTKDPMTGYRTTYKEIEFSSKPTMQPSHYHKIKTI